MSRAKRLLILGGTGEAAALAQAIDARFGTQVEVTSSLAGRTVDPAPIVGSVRIGGFGGADGLQDYLRTSGIDILIDATHPFAVQISRNAVLVASASDLPLLRLDRPEWRPAPEDRWIEVADPHEAVAALRPLARRIWLTIGNADLTPFAAIPDAWFLVRTISAPATMPPLPHYELLLGRGPFAFDAERRVIAEHRIDALVTKASGGETTVAKLHAARDAKIPIIMIRRPVHPAAQSVTTIPEVLDWIGRHLNPS